jgi:hypothetical protein
VPIDQQIQELSESATRKLLLKMPGGVGVGLQSTTLITLLGIGWLARDTLQGLETKISAQQQTASAMEHSVTALRQELGDLKGQLQLFRTDMASRAELHKISERIDSIERCLRDRRRCEL